MEAERTKQREHLLLSRTRVLHDLEHANNPRYQEILRRLDTITGEIARLRSA